MPNAPRAQPAGDVDYSTTSAPTPVHHNAADAAQDEEEAREKLLKAADQIDQIETNSESNKAAMDDLKTQLGKLQQDNTALKLQVSTLQDTEQKQQDAIDKMRADQARERQALIDEVSSLIASKPAPHHPKHVDADATPKPDTDVTPEETTPPPPPKKKKPDSLAPPPDTSSGPTTDATPDTAASTPPTENTTPATPTATPHPRKGWMYVVKSHETLSAIVEAFRDQGVSVTVAQVRKANGLTSKSVLKVGQKLFIPKPGT